MAIDGVARVKAGDQVWHHETQEALSVAAVDEETGRFAASGPVELWLPIGSCIVQVSCSFAIHQRTLVEWARDAGRRGEVSRRVLANLWSAGRLAAS